jgi:hypothetical protein
MLFLCNSLDSHPTIIFKPNGSFWNWWYRFSSQTGNYRYVREWMKQFVMIPDSKVPERSEFFFAEYVSEWPSLFRSVVISAFRNQWRSAMHKRICLGNFRRPCVTALHISFPMELTKL